MRQRMEKLLVKLQGPVTAPELVRLLRAVEALERMGTPEAVQGFQTLTQGAPAHRVTGDARAAGRRLAGDATAPPGVPRSRIASNSGDFHSNDRVRNNPCADGSWSWPRWVRCPAL